MEDIDFTPVLDYVEPDHGCWNFIPLEHLNTLEERRTAHRLNSLGSSFYFSKVVLKNTRLSENIHLDMCLTGEKAHLKEIIEIPRDHFKSTIYSETFPIWWALPFGDSDINMMQKIGMSDEWITWMKRAHNPDTRTLLVSENSTNATKLGVRIDGHYTHNEFFKKVFPEIQISRSDSWTQFSKTHKRTQGAKPHGEGTYDYIGVGGALQSRHYDRVVQDDLVGKAALESDTIMNKTHDYHKLLVGAFDSTSGHALDNDEIIVGNRWSYRDLNSLVKEEEPYFNVTNHSALGGCCKLHPSGVPIFPEEFSVQKLSRFRKRLGTYLFSCQFLNQPVPPKDLAFDLSYLSYYKWVKLEKERGQTGEARTGIRHESEVKDGRILNAYPDLDLNKLQIYLVADPNHSQEEGRCNHGISVTGYLRGTSIETERVYLLDEWAESTNTDEFIKKIYELAEKYKLGEIYLETNAAQIYLKYHLDFRNRIENRKLKIREVKSPKTKDAKHARIKALSPLFENRQFFVRDTLQKFIKEYSFYPNAKTRDILDTIGYSAEIWGKGWSNDDLNDYFHNYTPPMGTGPCGY